MKRRIEEVIDLVDSDDPATPPLLISPVTQSSPVKVNSPVKVSSPGSASKGSYAYMAGPKIYLKVPYGEKDKAKALGAKFDGEQKLWFVPMDVDAKNIVQILSVFNKHWSVYLTSSSADCNRLTQLGAISCPTGKWYIEPNSNLNYFTDWLVPTATIPTTVVPSSVASTPTILSPSNKQAVIDTSMAKLSILSWNVNGIGDNYGDSRMNKMCDIVVEQNADVVFLQEVVIPIYDKLVKVLSVLNYSPLNAASDTCVYFTAAFIKNRGSDFNISVLESNRIPFSSSMMGRDYCVNKIRIEKNQRYHDITIINTHLESLKEYSEVRKSQMKQCLGAIDTANGTGLLLGDLNIRENEMKEIKSGRKFHDVWEDHNKDAAEKNTWFGQGEVVGFKARYDRMLYVDNAASLKYSEFKLFGKENYTFVDEFSITGGMPKASPVR